jgi:large subunit ribosomal protein L13
MPTYLPKVDPSARKWFVIDANNVVLGKLAVTAANILTGKRKPIYTPFLDTGDHLIVLNAAHVHLTGRKETEKLYRTHSGYPGGLKTASAAELRKKKPERIIEAAVWGMLPKGRLGRAMFSKLRVYPGQSHPHQSQKPDAVAIK